MSLRKPHNGFHGLVYSIKIQLRLVGLWLMAPSTAAILMRL